MTEHYEPGDNLGAWVVFGWDWNAYPLGLFPTELEARRFADARGYGEVAFWPWGDWDDRRQTEVAS